MMEREAFLMKPKHQYHSTQWGDWVYGAQAWKERRLLCASEFIPIEKRSWIPKNGGKRSFSYKTNDPMSLIPMKRMSLWSSITKKKGRLLCESVFVPHEKWALTLKNNEKRSFSYKTKA